jgi:hypothetical protein
MTMDCAFVPGIGDPALEGLNSALQFRPNTTSVLVSQTATLANFLNTLETGVETLGWPAFGDLLIGAHGDSFGELKLSLDDTTTNAIPPKIPANYETLQSVAATKTINIPNDVRSANTSVRLLSCSIGADPCRPFLTLLKTVMGNPSSLTAPRYVHTYALSADNSYVHEWMNYEFLVTGGIKPLPTRDAVVGKFIDAGFQYFDGTNVPDEIWEQWVPPAAKLTLKPAVAQTLKWDFPVRISVGNNFSAVLKAQASWTSGVQPFDVEPIPYTNVSNIVIPTTLNVELPKIDKYKSSHPYPVYQRYGFNTLDDFIKGWSWTINLLPNNMVKFIGSRYIYLLEIPITKPGTDEWIFNQYHTSQAPIINFSDSNQPYRLFGVV